MARDITVTYRCDWCDTDIGDEGEGLDTRFRLGTVDGLIDLCDDCVAGDLLMLAEAVRPMRVKRKGKAAHRCDVCGREFTREGNLNRHLDTAHGR